jgi:hypothetical protein
MNQLFKKKLPHTLLAVLIFGGVFYVTAFRHDLTIKLAADLTGNPAITVNAGVNGAISPGTTVLTNGSSQLFTITANSGYHIQDVLVDGASIGAQAYYTFSNVTSSHTISASFGANEAIFTSTPFGGANSKSKGINYMPTMFVPCPTTSNRADWVNLFKLMKIRVADFDECFLMGDFTPKTSTQQELKDTVSYFKENGIAVALHHYSDLIDPNSVMAQDTKNIRHDADGSLKFIYGGYMPTPAASSVIAQKMADAYNYYGFNGEVYFDAIDYYSSINERDTGMSFITKVLRLIPGGAPMDAATVFSTANQYYSRRGVIDSPHIDPNSPDDPNKRTYTSLKTFTDYWSSYLQNWIQQSYDAYHYWYEPYMGWLWLPGQQISVDDINYYLAKCNSMGAGYGIWGVTPTNYKTLTPLITAISNYNATWNIKVLTIKDTSGSPISGAAVDVVDSNSSSVFSGTTNSQGYVAANIQSAAGPFSVKTTYTSKTQNDSNNLVSDTEIIFNPSSLPVSKNPVCGDAVCGSNESCSSCFLDCGACPPSTQPVWDVDSQTNTQQTGDALTIDQLLKEIERLKGLIAQALAAKQSTLASQQMEEILFQITPQGSIPQTFTFQKTLYLNTNSNDVVYLQKILNQDLDTQVASTGWGSVGWESVHFGPATQRAVQAFQTKYNIVSPGVYGYGIVGPATRAKLNEFIRR